MEGILGIKRKLFGNYKNNPINSVFNLCFARRKMKNILRNRQK